MGIRVPRITVSADFGDDRSIGDLSIASVGYGLHQAWVYATMFGTASVFGTQNYIAGLYGNSIALPYVVSILIYAACLIAGAVMSHVRSEGILSKQSLGAGALLTFLGTLLLLVGGSASVAVLEVASGFLTGIGSAILILHWGVQFARMDRASIILNTAIAASISVAVYAVCLHYLPYPAPGVLAAIIPLLEWAILRKHISVPDAAALRFNSLPINYGKFVWRFGVPVFAFGLALGMLRQSSVKNITAAATLNDQILMLLGAALATVLILITIVALGEDGRWSSLFRPLVPFVAVALFLVMFADMFDQPFTNMLLVSAFLCFESLMWIFFGDLSQTFRLSPPFVFGIGRGCLALAMLLGSLFPIIIAYWPWMNALGKPTMIVLILLVMVVAYALLPREREIEAIVVPCPLVKMVSSSIEDNALLPGELARALARVEATGGAGVSAGEEDAPEPSAAAGESVGESAPGAERAADAAAEASPGAERAADAGARGEGVASGASGSAAGADVPACAAAVPDDATGQGATPAGADVSLAGDSAAADVSPAKPSANVAEPSEAKLAMSAGRAAQVGSDTRAQASAGASDGEMTESFRAKCATVSNTYLLSRREAEIMTYLARGYNAASVQEKLFIAEGTAKTHIRHIYRKLDIHSQQELIRMVYDAE